MRIDVKGQALLPPPTNPSARAVAPMRVTLEWDRTLPSPKIIDRDDGYRIEWSADGNAPWTSLVNYTNQHGTFEIWCTCYPTRFYDNTITPGTTRHYRIKAVDDDDESAWSDVVSVTTPGLVDSGFERIGFGAEVSELDALNDQKVFRIRLEAGEEYRFTISGEAARHRVIVTGPGGTETWNDVLEANNTLIPRFTTQAAGEHQVKISHGGSRGQFTSLNAGWFQFALLPERDEEVPTLRPVAMGNLGEGRASLVGVLNTYGDVDSFGLALQPGKAYAARVRGRETNNGTAATPWIKRARAPSTDHDHNMGKPWVDGVTTTETSTTICAESGNNKAKCEEFQAFVIDLRGQTGAEQTWQIIIAPTARPDTRPYRVGTYEVDLRELSSSQLQGVPMPLRAWFASQPAQHDGSTRIKVRVAFSDAVDESPQKVGQHGVSVDGGEVASVRAVGGNAPGGAGTRSAGGQDEGPEDREVVWELEIEPDSDEDVTVSLEAWRPCGEPGAICTEDGRALSEGISTTVRGPAAEAQEPQDQEQKPQDQAAAAEQEPQQQEQPDQEAEAAAEQEPPQKPPPAPRNLTGVANGDGSVTLSWDAPGDDSVTGYRILIRHTVKQAPGVFSKLAANTGTTATTYTDRVASPETRYAYRVKAINAAGAGKRSNYVKVTTKRAAAASKPALADGPPGLAPNAPNPFNATTLIPYRLDADGPVRLEIYNLLGQRMRTLVDEVQAAGAYRVRWDARDGRGAAVAAGVYFIRLHHPGGVHTRRMLYLK